MSAMKQFAFRSPGVLRDRELSVMVQERIPGSRGGRAPAYHFAMRSSGHYAGHLSLRLGVNPDLLLYYGQIGYTVEPEFRGRHYAERGCRLILPLAREHGFQELWITCNPDNVPSRRTCERLGAVLVNVVPVPANHELYRLGDVAKCRYRLDLVPGPERG